MKIVMKTAGLVVRPGFLLPVAKAATALSVDLFSLNTRIDVHISIISGTTDVATSLLVHD